MSGFDPKEYERTGGMYDSDPEPSGLTVFGRELDPESRFAQDLGAFCRINTTLHDKAVTDLDTKVPDDYVFRTNIQISSHHGVALRGDLLPDVLTSGYLSYAAAKRIGYQIMAVSVEGDRDHHIMMDGQVALYQHRDEQLVFTAFINDGRSFLPHYITNSTNTAALDRGSAMSWYNSRRVGGWAETGILERGFMTGTLFLAKEYLAGRGYESINQDRARCLDIYDKLVAEGCTPLGPEELAGIVESSIRSHIEEHPEFAPLNKK